MPVGPVTMGAVPRGAVPRGAVPRGAVTIVMEEVLIVPERGPLGAEKRPLEVPVGAGADTLADELGNSEAAVVMGGYGAGPVIDGAVPLGADVVPFTALTGREPDGDGE